MARRRREKRHDRARCSSHKRLLVVYLTASYSHSQTIRLPPLCDTSHDMTLHLFYPGFTEFLLTRGKTVRRGRSQEIVLRETIYKI